MRKTIFCLPELEDQLKPVVAELLDIAKKTGVALELELVPSVLVPDEQIYVIDMDLLEQQLFSLPKKDFINPFFWWDAWVMSSLVFTPGVPIISCL